jgi:hypothetical protein
MMEKFLIPGLSLIGGGIAGYIFYYFWGCKGGCPITANPWMMVVYGAAAGFLIAWTK